MLDGEEKSDEDSLLFDFLFIQKSRTVLGLSPERRTVSSFVHAKEDGNPPKAHIPKKNFYPTFSLIFMVKSSLLLVHKIVTFL